MVPSEDELFSGPDFNPIEKAFSKLKALLRKQPSAQYRAYGTGSDNSSKSSNCRRETSSIRVDTIQLERETL
jgi:transposase